MESVKSCDLGVRAPLLSVGRRGSYAISTTAQVRIGPPRAKTFVNSNVFTQAYLPDKAERSRIDFWAMATLVFGEEDKILDQTETVTFLGGDKLIKRAAPFQAATLGSTATPASGEFRVLCHFREVRKLVWR